MTIEEYIAERWNEPVEDIRFLGVESISESVVWSEYTSEDFSASLAVELRGNRDRFTLYGYEVCEFLNAVFPLPEKV